MEPLAAAVMMCIPMTSGPIPPPSAVIDAFITAYNEHDMDTLRQLVAADARMGPADQSEMIDGRTVIGLYETSLFKRFPTVSIKVVQQISAGDMVAQTESISGVGEDSVVLSAYRIDRGCIVSMSYSK
ncbi:MAG: nuclear transport factor 2 family protein [Caulobacter sp.]|nr:nuclear transport factor 2 family protein [Caulobacter sp.]